MIGGGLAGLSCAVALRDAGLRVLVLEADSMLGGRAASWTDATTGDPVHIGPHIFLNHYPNMLALLDTVGTRDKVVWQGDGRFLTMVDGQREIPIEASPWPAPYHYVPSLLGDPATSVKDLVSNWPLVDLALRLDEAMVTRLDEVSAVELLRAAGVTPAFVERFWAFTAMSIMNVPLERCSAGALMRFYARLIGHPDLEPGFPDGGLGDVFAPACRARVEAGGGGEVRTGARVRELVVARDDGGRERVTGVVLESGERLDAKTVVAALPPAALARLAPPAWAERRLEPFASLARFLPVPYLSTYLWFDRKLTTRRFWARAFRAEDFNCDFYDLSNIHRGWRRRPSLVTCNVIGSDRLGEVDDARVIERTLEELAEYLPEARRARVVHARVHRIPMAIHAPEPGTEALRPPVRGPIEGLLLAGDWIATGFPSSMESAVRAGFMAAEEALADRGRTVSLTRDLPPASGAIAWLRTNARKVPLGRPRARLLELAGA